MFIEDRQDVDKSHKKEDCNISFTVRQDPASLPITDKYSEKARERGGGNLYSIVEMESRHELNDSDLHHHSGRHQKQQQYQQKETIVEIDGNNLNTNTTIIINKAHKSLMEQSSADKQREKTDHDDDLLTMTTTRPERNITGCTKSISRPKLPFIQSQQTPVVDTHSTTRELTTRAAKPLKNVRMRPPTPRVTHRNKDKFNNNPSTSPCPDLELLTSSNSSSMSDSTQSDDSSNKCRMINNDYGDEKEEKEDDHTSWDDCYDPTVHGSWTPTTIQHQRSNNNSHHNHKPKPISILKKNSIINMNQNSLLVEAVPQSHHYHHVHNQRRRQQRKVRFALTQMDYTYYCISDHLCFPVDFLIDSCSGDLYELD